MTNPTGSATAHRWAFLDGKLRTCRRCEIQQRLQGDDWTPAAPDACGS